MSPRADHSICFIVVTAIGIVPTCAPAVLADARPSWPLSAVDGPLFRRTGDAGIDIVRMPPRQPLPTTSVAPTPPVSPTTPSPRETARSQGRIITLQVKVGSLPADNLKGWLGIRMDSLDLPVAAALGLANTNGVLILETTPGSPASQAGLHLGDVVVAFGGKPVESVNDLRQRLQSASPGSAAVLDLWRVAANDEDFLRMLRRLADGGDPDVMYRLGRMYAAGFGVARNEAEAVQWHRKAAAAGNSVAEAALANMVLEGRGTTKDIQEGLRLLRSAVDRNNLEAMNRLGHLLVEGKIVNKDALEAVRLFTKGAEVGHAPSMVDIGVMYNNGVGIQVDHSKAAMWFRRAAELGHSGGMVNLGLLYSQGKGVETDFVKAAMWFKRAADLGNSGGMVNFGLLHAQGKGVERNDAAAVALYRKAVSIGNPAGMNNLAWMLQAGRGVERKDPEQAADLIMKLLDQRNEFAHRQMTQNYRAWTNDFRQALQRRLRDAGLYAGPIDGQFREPTIASINAYLNRNR